MPLFSRPLFEVRCVEDDDAVRLVLRGELDIATVPELVEALERAERRHPDLMVLDAEQLSFVDASGFKVLLQAARRALRDGRRVQLVNPSRGVTRTLRITGIDQTLDVVCKTAARGG
jgi:anti-sigma B factor antagonist